MNKYSITIICLIAMASPLSQATDSNDFFRFNPFSSTTDQCTKKSQDLSELNQLFNENTAPGETPDRPLKLMWLERELEIAKSNLAIIDGLKKIKQFKMEEYRKIYVRYADKNEKCANNTLIKQGAIGINDELEIIKNDKEKERQQALFDFNG